METIPLLGVKVITMDTKETTSTNPKNGDEEYKCTGLSKTVRPDVPIPPGPEVKNLSTTDLLAVLISSGCKTTAYETAGNLLKTFDGNLIELFTATTHELTQVEGITIEKARRIKVTFELVNRIESYFTESHPKIKTKEDIVKLLAPHMRYLKQKEYRVILLDNHKRLIRHCRVSLGSVDSVLTHPREIFRPAVVAGATSIILVHNNPSGDPEPSEDDINETKTLLMCSAIVDIKIVDHVIIGFTDHVSMKEKNIL